MLENGIDRSRRHFLKGGLSRNGVVPDSGAVHLPWLKLNEFFDKCSRCNDCLKACPEQIISSGDGGFPQIDFKRGECTFCGECANSCEMDLFQAIEESPWAAVAQTADGCLAIQGISCQTCRDNCDAGAIRFQPRLGGSAIPKIALEDCTGCGACVAPCPVDAIEIHARENQEIGSTENQGLGERHGA